MEQIFGRTFRRQEHPQPLWLRIVAGVGIVVLVLAIGWSALLFWEAVWAFYRAVPASRQLLVGRMVLFATGFAWIRGACAVGCDPRARSARRAQAGSSSRSRWA